MAREQPRVGSLHEVVEEAKPLSKNMSRIRHIKFSTLENQVYFYKDTSVLFHKHLTPTKALVEALHTQGRVFWIINPNQLQKTNNHKPLCDSCTYRVKYGRGKLCIKKEQLLHNSTLICKHYRKRQP